MVHTHTHTHTLTHSHTHSYTLIHTLIHSHTLMHTLTHTLGYYSATKNNEIMAFTATWMDLEIAVVSKVSQKEKDKY